MKLLGRGWQYAVYDLENGRVLKRYNTLFEAYITMLRDSFLNMRFPVLRFSYYYSEGKRNACRSLKKMRESSLDKRLFGNPKAVGEYEYEQDSLEPLSRYLKRASPDDGKKILDKFVEFSIMLIRNSVIEKNFNIANNFGLDNSGNITIIDLGELCFTEEEIKNQVKKRVWAYPDVLSEIPPNLRAYFLEKMDDALRAQQLAP